MGKHSSDPVKWQQTAEKMQTAIFICIVYPEDSLYQILLVLERFEIVLLPFSNPQFICMPAMCILLEIHVCLMIPQSYRERTSQTQWPQSSKWKLQCVDEEQVTGSIWMGFTTVQQTLLLCSNVTQGFHCGRQEKGEVPASLEHLYLKRGIWSDSQVTAQCVINVRADYSSVSLRGSDTAMLWMQTDIISWVFWHTSQ